MAARDHGARGPSDGDDPAGPRRRLDGFREEVRRSVRDFSPEERKLLIPLAAAGFFEQYDVALLTLAATDISQGLGVSIGAFGIGVAIIRLGSLGGIPFMRLADRIGRRSLLIVSLAAFTVLTGLTALAWSLAVFVVLQTLARVFLATEHNLASLVIAEEVRADRRGAALSLMGWIATTGPAAVAALLILVPLTPLDWRIFYVFALLPLAIVAWLRRRLTETKAFEVAAAEERIQPSLRPHVPPAYRPDFRRICLFVSGFGLVLTPFFLFGADLAQDEYGWKEEFSAIVLGSGVATVAGFYVGGRLSDRLGRRGALAAGHLLTAGGTLLVFSEVKLLFVPGFFLAVGAYACLQAVVLAYLAELFPTELRATLTAFVISAQVVSGSFGLAIVAGVAELVDDTSLPMLALAVLLVPMVALLRRLPETAGRDVIALR